MMTDQTIPTQNADVKPEQAQVYYPEMGEQPDRAKLFQRARRVGRYMFVEWAAERDGEARAVFKRLRIRPRIEHVLVAGTGRWKFRAQLTDSAWHKIHAEGDVTIEAWL